MLWRFCAPLRGRPPTSRLRSMSVSFRWVLPRRMSRTVVTLTPNLAASAGIRRALLNAEEQDLEHLPRPQASLLVPVGAPPVRPMPPSAPVFELATELAIRPA